MLILFWQSVGLFLSTERLTLLYLVCSTLDLIDSLGNTCSSQGVVTTTSGFYSLLFVN